MKKDMVLLILTLGFLSLMSPVYGRMFSSKQTRFVSPDPLMIEEKRLLDPQLLNLYSYCRGNPIMYIDPTGETVYMVAYANDDEDFRLAAETRVEEIQSMDSFDPAEDVVYMIEADSFDSLKNQAETLAQIGADQGFGGVGEFDVYSHAGEVGGPQFNGNYADDQHMGPDSQNMQQWGSIDFNWEPGAKAYFYGCNTGRGNNPFAQQFADKQQVETHFQHSEENRQSRLFRALTGGDPMKQKPAIPVKFSYPAGKEHIQFVNQFAFAQIDMDVIMDIGVVDLKEVLELNMKLQSGILQPQDTLEAVITNRFGMSISSFMKLKQQIDQIFQNLEKQGVLVKKGAPDSVQ